MNNIKLQWTQLEYWEKANHPEAWLALVSGGLTMLVTLLSVITAAYLTYRYTVKHSNTTHNTQVKIDRLHRDINALEKVWELLAYMSFSESDKAIIKWREERDTDNKKIKHYYFQLDNLKQFILIELQRAFYSQHAGLFLPQSISKQIFEYRSLLMGLYIRHENNPTSTDDLFLAIDNPKLIEKLQKTYEALNRDIKSELDSRYQQLFIDDQ
jgi:hypothetical protein